VPYRDIWSIQPRLSHDAVIEARDAQTAEAEARRLWAENAEHDVFSFDDSASTESRSRRFRRDPYDRDRRRALVSCPRSQPTAAGRYSEPMLFEQCAVPFESMNGQHVSRHAGPHHRSRLYRARILAPEIERSPFWREEGPGSNRRYFLWELDLIAFDAGNLAFVNEKMLRVEGTVLGQLYTVAFNFFHNANLLAVSVDNFHVFADLHSVSP
jgi:hypothetical protein